MSDLFRTRLSGSSRRKVNVCRSGLSEESSPKKLEKDREGRTCSEGGGLRQGRKRITAALLSALILCLPLPFLSKAAVTATPEAAGSAGTIYIAGNPGWYPVEYYDRSSGSYKGILPEVLERISEKTGLDFTYIRAGYRDQRRRLAENGQVEMVSGCAADEEWLLASGMQTSKTVFPAVSESRQTGVCLAFTGISDPGLVRTVESALDEITPQEITEISVRFMGEHPAEMDGRKRVLWFGILLMLLVLAAVQSARLYRYKRSLKRDTRIDPLTGIWNKAYFIEFFEKFISEQYRNLYCVVYIGFDIVRAERCYGEPAAEEQLCFAAHELRLSARDNEAAARVGNGGFAVVRPSSGEKEIQTWTLQLLERLNQYTERYGKDYRPDFHAGIYMLRHSDRDCETVLFNARRGYQKAADRNEPFVFVRSEHLERENERLRLKKQTLGALQNREFQMFLQFVVDGKDGNICGAEAVSRWDHPQRGLLFPGSYIELMESEGTIAELDFYIFEETCRLLEQWKRKDCPLAISCNFSRRTIEREDFVRRIREISESHEFDRRCLVLEITEEAMGNNREAVYASVCQCREMGFFIVLDDMGGGYTSFADLRDYPIDIVKIDRSILNAAVTRRGEALLSGIVALLHNLEMKVLCEGAETQPQADLLRRIGCDYIQGYYFYRPLPLEEAERVLDEIEKNK